MKLRDRKRCKNYTGLRAGSVMCDFFKVIHVRIIGDPHTELNNFDVLCPKERMPR